MSFVDFMATLTIPQQIFILLMVIGLVWIVVSPYYSLWRLKDIQSELFTIGKELKELKEVIKKNGHHN